MIEAGPDLAEHGVVRWRLRDLCALVAERFSVTYHEQGLSKLIKRLGFRCQSASSRDPLSAPKRYPPDTLSDASLFLINDEEVCCC